MAAASSTAPARLGPGAPLLARVASPERFYGWYIAVACLVMMCVTVGVSYYGLSLFLEDLVGSQTEQYGRLRAPHQTALPHEGRQQDVLQARVLLVNVMDVVGGHKTSLEAFA